MTHSLVKAEPSARRIRAVKCCDCGGMTSRVMPKERGDDIKLAICEVCYAVSNGSEGSELISPEQFATNVENGWKGVTK